MQLKKRVEQCDNGYLGEPIVNISGYRFVELLDLPQLRASMLEAFNDIGVKGTILIAEEGINAAIAGTSSQIASVRASTMKLSLVRLPKPQI